MDYKKNILLALEITNVQLVDQKTYGYRQTAGTHLTFFLSISKFFLKSHVSVKKISLNIKVFYFKQSFSIVKIFYEFSYFNEKSVSNKYHQMSSTILLRITNDQVMIKTLNRFYGEFFH